MLCVYYASVQDNTILRLVSEQETLRDNKPSYINQSPALLLLLLFRLLNMNISKHENTLMYYCVTLFYKL